MVSVAEQESLRRRVEWKRCLSPAEASPLAGITVRRLRRGWQTSAERGMSPLLQSKAFPHLPRWEIEVHRATGSTRIACASSESRRIQKRTEPGEHVVAMPGPDN